VVSQQEKELAIEKRKEMIQARAKSRGSPKSAELKEELLTADRSYEEQIVKLREETVACEKSINEKLFQCAKDLAQLHLEFLAASQKMLAEALVCTVDQEKA